MMLFRGVMIIYSKWNMKITEYYVYWQLVILMVGHTMPQDWGSHQLTLIYWQNWVIFICFGFGFKGFILAISIQQIYIGVFVRYMVYQDPLNKTIVPAVLSLIWQIVFTGIFNYFINWLGHKFVKAEVPRIGNENLLNGLKEGVFVTD